MASALASVVCTPITPEVPEECTVTPEPGLGRRLGPDPNLGAPPASSSSHRRLQTQEYLAVRGVRREAPSLEAPELDTSAVQLQPQPSDPGTVSTPNRAVWQVKADLGLPSSSDLTTATSLVSIGVK
jgi:hypothetical protein